MTQETKVTQVLATAIHELHAELISYDGFEGSEAQAAYERVSVAFSDLRHRLASTEAADALLREALTHIKQVYRITGNLEWAGNLKSLAARIDTHLNATQGASHEQG